MTSTDPPNAEFSMRHTLADHAKKLLLCIGYIITSAALIRYNKFMMEKQNFPHALALAACHMVVSSVCCWVIYLVKPSMLPAMEVTRGSRLTLFKWFIPIGFCFAVMLYTSNQAYKYCNVTFLQFMKEANAMLCFGLSWLVGLNSMNRLQLLVIIYVISTASISVSGEVSFSWFGFVLQAISQLVEVSRMVMSELVLSGRKLDPLTYTLFLAPVCLVVLIIANAIHWSHGTFHDFTRTWPLVLGNCFVAFALNLLVATVIKECSALGLIMCGICKDICIVLFSALAFDELVTGRQICGFALTLVGVFYWSLMKAKPDSPVIRASKRLLCMEPEAPGEKTQLFDKAGDKIERKV